jgi:hypothetical protein
MYIVCMNILREFKIKNKITNEEFRKYLHSKGLTVSLITVISWTANDTNKIYRRPSRENIIKLCSILPEITLSDFFSDLLHPGVLNDDRNLKISNK